MKSDQILVEIKIQLLFCLKEDDCLKNYNLENKDLCIRTEKSRKPFDENNQIYFFVWNDNVKNDEVKLHSIVQKPKVHKGFNESKVDYQYFLYQNFPKPYIQQKIDHSKSLLNHKD